MPLAQKLYFSGWLAGRMVGRPDGRMAGWPTVRIMLLSPAGAWAELGKILQKIEPLKFFPKCSIFCYPPAMILFTMIAINNLALIAELLWKIFIGCGHIAEQYSIK